MLLTTASAPPAWDPWDTLTTRHPHVCVRDTPHLPARVEQAVEAEATRRLIPLGRLQAALAWTACEAETAEALDVDIAMLRTRIAGLTEAERAQIDQSAA